MSRFKIVPVIFLVIAAFALLYFSVRSTTLADEGQDGLMMLPTDKIQAAPDWALPDAATGHVVRLLVQSRRSPVVFTFWATGCGPCREELPHLEQVSQKYRDRVAFYGVDSDDPRPVMTAFASQYGLTFPMLSDARRDAATRYEVEALPILVVVDRHGKVRAVSVGYDLEGNLYRSLSQILDILLSETKET